jgi:hypothetical protein
VRVAEGIGHFERDLDRFVDTELLLAIELVADLFALNEGHHVVKEPVRLTRIDEAQDVRMLQLRGELDLSLEPFPTNRRGEIRMENLDRYLTLVPNVSRQEHGCHSTASQFPFDLVSVGDRGL